MDSPVHPMGLWDGTGHQHLGVCIWVGHVRIPWTVPSIPWDCGMGQDTRIWGYASGLDTLESHGQSRPSHGTVWDIWVGHVRIPWTVPSIPWDCGMGRDTGIWGYASGWDPLESHGQSRPSHGTVGWDGTPGFGGMHLGGTR